MTAWAFQNKTETLALSASFSLRNALPAVDCFISSTVTDFAVRMSTTAMCDLHFSCSTTADNRKFEHPVINVFCIFKFDDTNVMINANFAGHHIHEFIVLEPLSPFFPVFVELFIGPIFFVFLFPLVLFIFGKNSPTFQ
jgi:hypothetical protein